jgi:hypothetical protein
MRRIVVISTALAVLAAGGVALAAIASYGIHFTFSGQKGTPSKPKPISFTQHLSASGTNGNRTATLLDIKTKMYGIVADGKHFPTCSLAKIAAAKKDTSCSPKALVATGAITAVVGSSTNFKIPGAACNPLLHVWNGGQGKLVFFFVDAPGHLCLGGALTTGAVGPYAGHYSVQGKYLVTDVPIPTYVDFPAPGLVGSLMTEDLTYSKNTVKVGGKTYAANASIGCKNGKRPYSVTFKATQGGKTETKTVSAKASC